MGDEMEITPTWSLPPTYRVNPRQASPHELRVEGDRWLAVASCLEAEGNVAGAETALACAEFFHNASGGKDA